LLTKIKAVVNFWGQNVGNSYIGLYLTHLYGSSL
jgi:hypothetical protein